MGIWLSFEEQEELILKNRNLVRFLVNKLGVAPNDYDDMVSIGMIGLIKAAATFDKSKKRAFSTYAGRCINNELFMHYRKEKQNLRNISLDDPIGISSDGEELTLRDKIPVTDGDFMEKIEQRELFAKIISIILNRLDSRERLIVLSTFAGAKQSFIAKTFHISQSYVSRLVKGINEKIKSYLVKEKSCEGFFLVTIKNDEYEISFIPEDSNFDVLLESLKPYEDFPGYKISSRGGRITIQMPIYLEAFSILAQILQEIDKYKD